MNEIKFEMNNLLKETETEMLESRQLLAELVAEFIKDPTNTDLLTDIKELSNIERQDTVNFRAVAFDSLKIR